MNRQSRPENRNLDAQHQTKGDEKKRKKKEEVLLYISSFSGRHHTTILPHFFAMGWIGWLLYIWRWGSWGLSGLIKFCFDSTRLRYWEDWMGRKEWGVIIDSIAFIQLTRPTSNSVRTLKFGPVLGDHPKWDDLCYDLFVLTVYRQSQITILASQLVLSCFAYLFASA